MTSSLSLVWTALWFCLLPASVLAQPSVPSADAVAVLVHRFVVPKGESWGQVAIDLVPGKWRVDGLEGRLASGAQVRLALRDLVGLEIGGRCSGWIDGPTAYPCGFSLRDIDFAGMVAERYAAIAMDWAALNAAREMADLSARPERHASDAATSPRRDQLRFVALHLPSAYLGDKGQAFGSQLKFEIRAISNAQAPSVFDLDSGLVILRSRLRGERS